MTQHAEVIYETGAKSIVSVDSLDELKAGLYEHNRRAQNGENAQEGLDRPAERVKRVILYDQHPADLVPVGSDGSQPVDAQEAHKLVDAMTKGDGSINMHQLTAALRDEASPVFPLDQGRHESMYKMDGKELQLDFLSDNKSSGGGTGV